MKNGRALRGHRRVLTPIGEMPAMHRAPAGGYEVGCICERLKAAAAFLERFAKGVKA